MGISKISFLSQKIDTLAIYDDNLNKNVDVGSGQNSLETFDDKNLKDPTSKKKNILNGVNILKKSMVLVEILILKWY